MSVTVDEPLRRPLRLYLRGYAISMCGTGLVMPLNAIFLVEHRHMAAAAVAAYFVISSLTAMVANPFAATWGVRSGPYLPYAVGLALQAAGTLIVGAIDSAWTPLVAAFIGGIGRGAFFATQSATLTRLFGTQAMTVLFGRKYQISNLSVGVASLAAGFLVTAFDTLGYLIGYALNAASFIAFGLITLGPVRRTLATAKPKAGIPDAAQPAKDASGHQRGLALKPYRDRRFLPLIVLVFVIVLFGFAQFEAVIPIVLRTSVMLPVWAITAAYTAVNCVVVVVAQRRAIAWVQARDAWRGLSVAIWLWLISLVPATVALHVGPLIIKIACIAVFAVIFALGEVYISPSLQPLAVRLAPHAEVATYTAATSMSYSLGLLMGPSLMLPFFNAFGGMAYWTLLACGLLLGVLVLRAARAGEPVERPAQIPAQPVTTAPNP